jgi:hypothetical protein
VLNKINRSFMNFIEKIKNKEIVSFTQTLAHIDEHYTFVPTAFTNGNQVNKAGENNGSCKVFSFAKLNGLSKEETLLLFGNFYQDVLSTPNATDHQNIRNFMATGWEGIQFETEALKAI